MGDVEKAFRWLETSYKEGNPDLIELNCEPVFGGMRADPRFGELVAAILLARPGQSSGHVLGLHRMDEHFRTTPVEKERTGRVENQLLTSTHGQTSTRVFIPSDNE